MKSFSLLIFSLVFCCSNLFAQTPSKFEKNADPLPTSVATLVQQRSSEIIITKEHTSRISGIHHVNVRQAINGIEVLGTESSVHLDVSGAVLVEHSNLLNNIQQTLRSNAVSLSPEQAIQAVARQKGYAISELKQLKQEKGINRKATFSKSGISSDDIPVKLAYLYQPGVGTTLVWELMIVEKTSPDMWLYWVDAGSGQIVDQRNLTVSCNIMDGHEHSSNTQHTIPEGPLTLGEYRAHHTESMTTMTVAGSYNVFPMPVESPNYGVRAMVADPSNTVASPYGWHDTNGVIGPEYTRTQGNNCEAYDDGTAPDGAPSATDYAEGGPSLIFDFPFNPVYSVGDPSEDAAITNLFYWTNIVHDVIYHYGFDEAAGNFQVNNYGNGGLGGDSVKAEGQDGGGTCNANFSTPADGTRPRMQMYVCARNGQSRDGTIDNGVIVHEYGHGISNRLSELYTTESRGMGEGWSDYYAVLFTMKVGDNGVGPRPIGTWLYGEGPTGGGIRNYPYSTDMTINPQTYGNTVGLSQVHAIGEIWAVMLWDMTWDLIAQDGFDPNIYNGTGGNNKAIALVTEALKLQASSPGFVDARDAILLADQALYGGANECLIWSAFARRGLGYSAIQGGSSTTSDNVEAFDLPPALSGGLEFTEEVCLAGGAVTLEGGVPTGGVYSGTGVTDDGNGETFTFDPTVTGEGDVNIQYVVTLTCGGGNTVTVNDILTVTNNAPEIICQGSSAILPFSASGSDTPNSPITSSNTTTSSVNIPETGSVTAIVLTLNIEHTWTADLDISLISPSGTTLDLSSDNGGNGDNYTNTTFQDGAPSITSGEAPFTGTFSPEGGSFASTFGGENINGDWTLSVYDDAAGDEGTLLNWNIEIGYEALLDLPPLEVELDANGMATVTAESLIYQSSIECGGLSYEAGNPATATVEFDNSNVGLNYVDVIVTSDTGVSSSCVAEVLVLGIQMVCPSDKTVDCGADTSPGALGSADATSTCESGLTISYSDSVEESCGNTQIITRTWTASDDCGNSESCDQIITVTDTTPPVIICPSDVSLECGSDTSPNNTGLATGTDGCGNVQITFSDNQTNTCGTTGTLIRIWTATDDCGNTASCSQIITITDSTAPSITCPPNVSVECGNDTSPVSTGQATGSDNCGNVQINYADVITQDCGTTYTIIRTWVAADDCGNTASCSQEISVIDSIAPTIICPDDVSVVCGSDTSPSNTGVATGTDGCGNVQITFSDNLTPGCGATGTLTRNWTATDDCGNTASCNQIITIIDSTVPSITCPPNATVECGDDTSPASTGEATGSDSCGNVQITYWDSFDTSCGSAGTLTRTWRVTDDCGNQTSCVQLITIIDTTAPSIICPADISLECGSDTSPSNTGVATGTDGCGNVQITFSDNLTPGCGATGTLTRTWTAVDGCGNEASCTQEITFNFAPPIVFCPADLTLQCGQSTDPSNTGEATAIDGCGYVDITYSDAFSPGCGDLQNIARTWTATDACGNLSSCTQTITVIDSSAPSITCPPNVTVECGDDTSPASTGEATGSDSCGIVQITYSDSFAVGCGPAGTLTRTWTATDDCGNTASCAQFINVVDTTPPNISCPSDIIVDSDSGACGAVVYFTVSADDGCGTVNIVQTTGVASGDLFLVGTTTNTFVATDSCGNTAQCSFTVTVNDTEAPQANCVAPFSVELDENGEVHLDVSDIDNGSTDNCGIVNASISPSVFDCSNTGTNTVVLTLYDAAGNSASCSTDVTIEKRAATIANLGAFSGQYSDEVTLRATATDDLSGTPLSGNLIEFTIGTQSVSALTDATGTASASLVLDQAPAGTYDLVASFNGDSCYLAGSDTDAFGILQENAIVEYTSQTLQATNSSNSGEATVLLVATIQDISVDPANNLYDPDAGDIRNASVKFVNRENGQDITNQWIPVTELIDPSDNRTGTVSYEWNVDIGQLEAESFTVGIRVNNYYVKDSSDDNVVITVYKANGDFVTGAGNIRPDNSAGQYASSPNLKVNFGFNVKYNGNGRTLKGHANVIFRILENDEVRTYQIKGNAIQSLGIDASDPDESIAQFRTKATLKDITDPQNPISLGGNLRLYIEMTDKGEPGFEDGIAITLTTNNGALLFSSDWNGLESEEIVLNNGNILIHSGYGSDPILEIGSNEADFSSLHLLPNPAQADIILSNPNLIGLKTLRIYDLVGRLIKEIPLTNVTNTQIDVSELATATYMFIVKGDNGQAVFYVLKE